MKLRRLNAVRVQKMGQIVNSITRICENKNFFILNTLAAQLSLGYQSFIVPINKLLS